MTDKEKVTVSVSSVGADRKQPPTKSYNKSIADLPGQGNLQSTNNNPNNDNLQVISMTELYDTAYPPKLPVIDGLLYNGTYLFVGAPKIGKSFFMAQIGYHISMGLPLWGHPVQQGTVLYLAWKMIMQGSKKDCPKCLAWRAIRNFILPQNPNH